MANKDNRNIKRNIHIAYIIQGGKVISMSSNSLRSMSGLDYNRRYTNDSTCHAEMACIKNIKRCNREKVLKKKTILYSLAFKVTVDSNNNINYKLQTGKPCRSCVYNLIRYNIRNIWYSNNNSELIKLYLDNNVAVSSVISSGSIIKLNLNRIYINFPYKLFNMIKNDNHNTLVLSRHNNVFKIGIGNIVLLQYYDEIDKKIHNCKIEIIETYINRSYHSIIKLIPNYINTYKYILKKTKTYILIKFIKIN